MNRKAISLFFILALILLSACASPAPQTKPGASEPNVSKAYPVPEGKTSGYPAPENLKVYGPDELPATPATIPQPQNGKAAVNGTIFSFTGRVIIPDTVYYLTPAIDGDKVPGLLVGPDEAKGDIIGRTDAQGSFSMDNVPPGNYYLAVWAPYSWVLAVDTANDPPEERLISLQAGQQEMLGVIQVSWP